MEASGSLRIKNNNHKLHSLPVAIRLAQRMLVNNRLHGLSLSFCLSMSLNQPTKQIHKYMSCSYLEHVEFRTLTTTDSFSFNYDFICSIACD